MTSNHGSFVISLDFELMWGILDHDEPMSYRRNIEGVRSVIPQLLKLFEEYNIHATWGIVGSISYKNFDEYINDIPDVRPSYNNRNLSPYQHIAQIRDYDSAYFFAPKLIDKIANSNNQEIALHTYSHYYCMENGQTKEEFEEDIKKAIQVLKLYTTKIDSIIFPRNQANDEYTDVLEKLKIYNYRGNEKHKIYESTSKKNNSNIVRRMIRLLDAYVNISGDNTYKYDEIKDGQGLINIRSSRFLRPYNKRLGMLEPFKIRRIKKQMLYAAKNNRVFHLWWHPHNFGININRNMKNLIQILDYYKELKEKYKMKSLSMNEVGALVR